MSMLVLVVQFRALYPSFKFLELIPAPLPIPETVSPVATDCPVVYGLKSFGFVPVIGLEKRTCASIFNEILKLKKMTRKTENINFIITRMFQHHLKG